MMQAQTTRSEQEREKRLVTIIKSQGVVDAERELSRYEPGVALPLLIKLLTKETQAIQQRKRLVFVCLAAFLGGMLLYRIFTKGFPNIFPFFVFWGIGSWRDKSKKQGNQHIDALATLLMERVKRAERSELGALLELAPLAWENAILLAPVRDRLASLLPRTPTDELFRLTLEQRTGLQVATRKAIDEARHNAFFEPLAVAGLLALGSLKDSRLRKEASTAAAQHSRGHVCAAAEEYLRQSAN